MIPTEDEIIPEEEPLQRKISPQNSATSFPDSVRDLPYDVSETFKGLLINSD
jgi:hypothetical protein